MGKTAVMTDIHGRFTELMELLEQVPPDAKLVFLGDYVDRGTQSAEVVKLVRSLHELGAVCLRGNHEDMMSSNQDMWLANGGSATLASYRDPLTGVLDGKQMMDDVAWFNSLPRLHHDRHRIYVHAGVDVKYNLDHQPERITQWFRYPDGADIGYGRRHVVHGHTPGVLRLANRTCLDAGRALACGIFDDDIKGGPVELLWA